MLNRKKTPLKAAQLSENKAEEMQHYLTAKPIIRHILPYLTKNDIDALRLTSKPIYKTISSLLFSNCALLRESPASRLSRNNVLRFLSATNQVLPKGIMPSDLIGHFGPHDSINVYATLLRFLLKQYQVSTDVAPAVVDQLKFGDMVYGKALQALMGATRKYPVIESDKPCRYQDIIHTLGLLQGNESILFSKAKKIFYDNTFHVLEKLKNQLKRLDANGILNLTPKEQKNLTQKLFNALPILGKYIDYLRAEAFFRILFMLSYLLKQEHNKEFLTKNNKNKLADFICLLENFFNQLNHDFSLILKEEKWWHQFQITDLIFAADLDLSRRDHPYFLSSVTIMQPSIDRKHAFYLALKETYLINYTNGGTNLPSVDFQGKRKVDCFLMLTSYFLDSLSNVDVYLVINELNAIAEAETEYEFNAFEKCVSCLGDLYERADNAQLQKMKAIAIKHFNTLSWRSEYSEGLLLKLMQFTEKKKAAEMSFKFSDDEMREVMKCILGLINQYNKSKEMQAYLIGIIKVFIRISNEEQLKAFAVKIKMNQILSDDKNEQVLSAHLIVTELEKREISSDSIEYFKRKLKEKMDLICDIFNSKVAIDGCRQVTYSLSNVIAEKNIDAELLICSFLNYFSRMAEDTAVFRNRKPNIDQEFFYHLVHRMSRLNLMQFRQALMNILNSLIESKTKDPGDIEFGFNLFAYLDFVIPLINDNFSYLNVLLPMLVNWNFDLMPGAKERLLSIIGWQLISQNHPLPNDDYVDNVNYPACVLIKLLADKVKEVHLACNSSNQANNSEEKKSSLRPS